ncbi:MAG: hypothetical protein K5879_00480 [Lachnospiraceae bacterium]|nr:hypothetical protein [Lachnospiraceae bacterium]
MAKTKNANEVFSSQRKQLGLLMNEVNARKENNRNELSTIQERLNTIDNDIKVALENGNQAEYERLSITRNYLTERRNYLTKPQKMIPMVDKDDSRKFVRSIFSDAKEFETAKVEEIKTLCTNLYYACKELETVQANANGLLQTWNENIRNFYDEDGIQSYHSNSVSLLRDLETGLFKDYVVGGVDNPYNDFTRR